MNLTDNSGANMTEITTNYTQQDMMHFDRWWYDKKVNPMPPTIPNIAIDE